MSGTWVPSLSWVWVDGISPGRFLPDSSFLSPGQNISVILEFFWLPSQLFVFPDFSLGGTGRGLGGGLEIGGAFDVCLDIQQGILFGALVLQLSTTPLPWASPPSP